MKKILNNKYTLILSILVIFVSLLSFSFADTTYEVNYTVGEHGTVNNKDGEFTEECIESLNSYMVIITPEDGYMVDKIIVDGEENTEYTEAAQSTLDYVIDDLTVTKDTNVEVTFKEIDNEQLKAMAEAGFNIKATSEGPGDIVTVFENNEGKYLTTDEEVDRTITWLSDTDNDALVKSVTINGVEDPSYAGKDYGQYIATSGDVDIHIVFEKSPTPLPGNEDDDEESYTVKTSAKTGGDITESYEYTVDEDNDEHEIVWTSDTGYVIDTVTINGVKKTENVGIGEEQGSYTFKSGDQSIDVTFTALSSMSSDAGSISIESDKKELKLYDEAVITLIFEPKDTSVDSTFNINLDDFEFVSCDKGDLKDNVVSGTIKSGTDKEVVTLKVKYGDGTIYGVVKASISNKGKTVENESDILLLAREDDAPVDEDISKYMNHNKNNEHPVAKAEDVEYEDDEDVVKESTETNTEKSNTNTSNNVKTGDETNNTIFYVLGVIAFLGLIVAFVIKRRVNKKIE